tara:strand:+ start:5420 stop:5683 length:264 start_codon:yes stop_codon:yes gene_type:complete
MKQKDMIELIRQHHPKVLEAEIRKAINRAQDEFCSETEILESSYIIDSTIGQRFYTLHPQTLVIKSVEVDNVAIPRLQGKPDITDID